MAEYIRKYPDAPTAEEIETGYAPSTIRVGPFLKFLFWTFAGLGLTYLIAYGSYLALDKVQEMEHAGYERMAARQPETFQGPPLQPSPGHPTVDDADMDNLAKIYGQQLMAKKLWQNQPETRTGGRPAITDAAVNSARQALSGWGTAQK